MKSRTLQLLFLTISAIPTLAMAQADRQVWEPVPEIVQGVTGGTPPSDAIILFDGENMAAWQHIRTGNDAQWELDGDMVTVVPGTGSIETRQHFDNMQLHVEFRTNPVVEGNGQSRGNSGIFLQSQFEVQILDSVDNPTYVNGQAAAIYLQSAPLVNASRGPGEWQSYDIVYTAPVYGSNGELQSPAYVTVFHNGVLVQNHVEIQGTTYTPEPEYNAICTPYQLREARDCTGKMPLRLQDHDQIVSYRNIWVREL